MGYFDLNKCLNCADSKIKTFLETKKEKVKLCVQFNLSVMFSFTNNEVHNENKLITGCLNKLCLHIICDNLSLV